MRPLVSVVIAARDAEVTLPRCLRALRRQSLPPDGFEVLVVDDGSTDATARVAEGEGARVLRQPPRGPAAARNHGARESTGEFLAFTDADCEPEPEFLERLIAPLRADPHVAGSKGVYVSPQTALVARFVQREYEDRYRRTARLFRRHGSIDFVDTYAAAFRRDAFEAAGGFDESFPSASVEDQELSFRLAAAGKRLVFSPEARVAHHGHASSIREYARKKFKIAFWKVAVLKRHPSRAVHDTHTPQTLKAQIILAALLPAGAALAGAAVGMGPAVGVAALFAGLFLLTSMPLSMRLARRDPAVALAAPALMFVRAVALGTGLVAGALGGARRPRLRLEQLVWLLLLCDVAAVLIAMRLAYLLRFQLELLAMTSFPPAPYAEYLKPIAVLVVLLPVLFSLFGLYRTDELHTPLEVVSATGKAVTLAILVVLSLGFYYRDFSYSRLVFAYDWAITIALCATTRLVLRRLVYARYAAGKDLRRALVIGDPSAGYLPGKLITDPAFGIDIVGWAPARGAGSDPARTLETTLDRLAVDEVLIADPTLDRDELLRVIEACEARDAEVRLVPPTYDLLVSHGDLTFVQGVALLRVDERRFKAIGFAVKRAFDLAVSATVLMLGAPGLVAIAAAIRATSEGPAMFSQLRAGQNGRPFRLHKFRTMVLDAERRLDELVDVDRLDEPAFKLRDDPRVTAVGRVLRRWSLDEAPQLWNVLKGDMSLVGPRPDEVRLVCRYNVWQRRRLKVKPGITGLQQVEARGPLSTLDDRVRLDVYYIRNQSFLLDFIILLRTVWAVARGKGAS